MVILPIFPQKPLSWILNQAKILLGEELQLKFFRGCERNSSNEQQKELEQRLITNFQSMNHMFPCFVKGTARHRKKEKTLNNGARQKKNKFTTVIFDIMTWTQRRSSLPFKVRSTTNDFVPVASIWQCLKVCVSHVFTSLLRVMCLLTFFPFASVLFSSIRFLLSFFDCECPLKSFGDAL